MAIDCPEKLMATMVWRVPHACIADENGCLEKQKKQIAPPPQFRYSLPS